MTTVLFNASAPAWESPKGTPVEVYRYVGPIRGKTMDRGKIRLSPDDLWVTLPSGKYARLRTNAHGVVKTFTEKDTSDTPPDDLVPHLDTIHKYAVPTAGRYWTSGSTITLDCRSIQEPIILLPATVYLQVTNPLTIAVRVYYYTYGLRAEIIYDRGAEYDEIQCGQKLRFVFYSRGLTTLDGKDFRPYRSKQFAQRVMDYYIVHQLRKK